MAGARGDLSRRPATGAGVGGSVSIDLVVPARDEQDYLDRCVERLGTLIASWPHPTRIIVVDSGSTDSTMAVATRLAEAFDHVCAMSVPLPGRGRALRAAWSVSEADLVAYTDVDLSGDPELFRRLVASVHDGADIAVASRLAPGAEVVRGARRELLSRGYSQLLSWLVKPPFADPQCGLKVLRTDACHAVLDDVVDEDWFFDTELLLRAWTSGLRIEELPARWTERKDSRVRIVPAIVGDVRGLVRLTAERVRATAKRRRPTAPMRSIDRSAIAGAALVETFDVLLMGAASARAQRTGGDLRGATRSLTCSVLGHLLVASVAGGSAAAAPIVGGALALAGTGVAVSLRTRRSALCAVALRSVVGAARVASLAAWVTSGSGRAAVGTAPASVPVRDRSPV